MICVHDWRLLTGYIGYPTNGCNFYFFCTKCLLLTKRKFVKTDKTEVELIEE